MVLDKGYGFVCFVEFLLVVQNVITFSGPPGSQGCSVAAVERQVETAPIPVRTWQG